MASPSKSPFKGIQFFEHFPKNYLRPYGEAGQAPDVNAIFNRLKVYNCEWLIRPKVALSELAATMTGNLNVLAEMPEMVNAETVHDMTERMSSILPTIAKFNTKDNSEVANTRDLKRLMRFFLSQDEEVDTLLDNCIKAGNAMYTFGIQMKVAKALLTNPDRYARMSAHGESRDSDFKKNPNVKTLFDYLATTSLQSAGVEQELQAKRSLLSQMDDLEDSDEDTHSKPKPKRKKNKQKKDLQDNVF